MPSVDDPHHRQLENDVIAHLKSCGFLVGSNTYHECMDKALIERLSHVYTPESLYVRTKPDRIAVHRTQPLCFAFEIKTNSGPHRNMALEALPLAHHRLSGLMCLYIYRDTISKAEKVFLSTDIPHIDKIHIPDRWAPALRTYFVGLFNRAFVGVPIHEWKGRRGSGSGDPFVVISEETVEDLTDLQDMVGQLAGRSDNLETQDGVAHESHQYEGSIA